MVCRALPRRVDCQAGLPGLRRHPRSGRLGHEGIHHPGSQPGQRPRFQRGWGDPLHLPSAAVRGAAGAWCYLLGSTSLPTMVAFQVLIQALAGPLTYWLVWQAQPSHRMAVVSGVFVAIYPFIVSTVGMALQEPTQMLIAMLIGLSVVTWCQQRPGGGRRWLVSCSGWAGWRSPHFSLVRQSSCCWSS